MTAKVWSGAALVSVVLHGLGAGALVLSTKPQDVPDQPVPEARFSIEAAEVPRSKATPKIPVGDAAAKADAPTSAARSGTLRKQQALTAPLATERLSPATPDMPAVRADTAAGSKIGAAQRADADVLAEPVASEAVAVRTADATVLSSTRPDNAAVKSIQTTAPRQQPAVFASLSVRPATVASAVVVPSGAAGQPAAAATPAVYKVGAAVEAGLRADTVPLSATPAPSALPEIVAAVPGTPADTSVSAALPDSSPTPVSTPTGQPANRTVPEAASVAPLPLPAVAGKAALAWSGETDEPLSATSLAAIAAFTQEGDLGSASAQVRDGIAGLLAAVPCARLQTRFLPDTGQLELRGHIPQDALRGPVLAALREHVGAAIPVSDQLLILPRPQCGALSGIAAVGLPQSTEQLTDPAVIGEDGFARNYAYQDGERLILDLTAPDYDSFLYLDYFVADGSVIHLQPNEIVPLEFALAKSAQSVGRAREGKPSLELTVSAPFGQEIAAAFAASVPLYEGVRPLQEPAAGYLSFLKERVAEARLEHPDFKGEWVYFFISTKAE